MGKQFFQLDAFSGIPDISDLLAVQLADGSADVQKIPISGMPFLVTPAGKNLTIAAAAIRPSLSGGVVVWDFIEDTAHGPIFFTSVQQSPDTPSRIRINFPTVKSIVTLLVAPDESFAGSGYSAGSTVATDWADVQLASYGGPGACTFQGNGTGWTSITSNANNLLPGYDASGQMVKIANGAGYSAFGDIYGPMCAVYNGTNDCFVRRVTSGLGAFNLAFELTKAGVVQTPTSADFITIMQPTILPNAVNAYDPAAAWISTFFNLWVIGVFELL